MDKCAGILIFVVFAALFSCNQNDYSVKEQDSDDALQIGKVDILREGKALRSSGVMNIGVFRLQGKGYLNRRNNVHYSYCDGKWAVSTEEPSPVYLNNNKASLCAYYPYNSSYSNGTASLTSQIFNESADLCYESGVSAVCGDLVSFNLHHAYAKFTFNFIKDESYPGPCAISNIIISNKEILKSNTMDLTTGIYSAGTASDVSVDPAISSISTGTVETKKVLVVPVKSLTGDLKLTFTVDSYDMSANISSYSSLKASYNYEINVTISGSAVYASGVVSADWDDVMSGSVNTSKIASEANCYMLPLGERVYIPVSRAKAGNPDHFTKDGTAGLLWTDNDNGVSPSGSIEDIKYNKEGGYISVTAGCAEGNGLVYFKNTSGEIVWSWHIWVTNYNPGRQANGVAYTITNAADSSYTFMDRNLGATTVIPGAITTTGFLYQWGRKDPFPGPESYTVADDSYESIPIYDSTGVLLPEQTEMVSGTGIKHRDVTVANNIDSAVMNPMIYYTSTGVWYTNDYLNYYDNTLWGSPDSLTVLAKTIYDPCPSGWRVPPVKGRRSPWSGLGTGSNLNINGIGEWNSYGVTWLPSQIGFWPAVGFRSQDGSLRYAGAKGFYSSSTAYQSAVNAVSYALTFEMGSFFPEGRIAKGIGSSVRCVRE